MSRTGWRTAAGRAGIVLCVSLTATGCALFRSPEPTVSAPAQSASSRQLERAEALLADDDLDAAAGELHSLVETHPSSPEVPQALFQLAFVYLAPGSPLHDGSQGIALLRNLVDGYPDSAWSLASETILRLADTNTDLRQVAAQLQAQLDRLKQIDIGNDG